MEKLLGWIRSLFDFSSLEKRKTIILILTGIVVGITRLGTGIGSIGDLVASFILGYILTIFVVLLASLLVFLFLNNLGIELDDNLLVVIICATLITICVGSSVFEHWVPSDDYYME